ncbi:crossover junction endodeoxyribonuclease RuvC [Bacillus glycinifermentans]|uniref:crossover junction endodeoxyribonuclease RuvC n=1 Tax=Bacillus glycinifermentans TaxID=1664069 RepID=UPI001FF144F4|nr:crossover junction endodeoxyribonuclease RuvC [Bacillus glycinifermentans]UOY86842.1 crossover junction endodeoxyribonuclease RuvC [Bacillus glycinifermentans]
MSKSGAVRVLGLDLSLTSPGFAIIEAKGGKARLIKSAHFKTSASTDQPLRYEEIEAFTLLFVRDNQPFDVIVREIWPPSKNYANNNKIHGAWSSIERALHRYGYEVDENVYPSTVKKTVTGNGNAKKPQVAESVREWLGLPDDHKFATDDHSDACAVALTYLIREKIIKPKE